MPRRNPLTRWLALPARRRWLILEAAALLLIARVAVRLLPFKTLTWFMERPSTRPALDGPARAALKKDVRWANYTASHRLSENIVCFPRALAAQSMLRRRGVATTLFYGAARTAEKGLYAHVWLQDGDEGVVGQRSAVGFAVLGRYPASQ